MESEPGAGLPAGAVYRVQIQGQVQGQTHLQAPVGDWQGAGTLRQAHEPAQPNEHAQAQAIAFDASAGVALLASALRAGVMLASSCRNGTCRTCMLRLVEGRIRYQVEWPGLLAEEKAEGWILPCVASPETDLVLAMPVDAA